MLLDMSQTSNSSNQNAILQRRNQNLILNEKSRQNKFTKSQKKINIDTFEQESRHRRKSCHCSECGDQSHYQFRMMNLPSYNNQHKQQEKTQEPQLTIKTTELRKSAFFHKFSLPLQDKNQKRQSIDLSLKIHGITKPLIRQNSLLKMISEGQERFQRRESNDNLSNSSILEWNQSTDSQSIKGSPGLQLFEKLSVSPFSQQTPPLKQNSPNIYLSQRNPVIIKRNYHSFNMQASQQKLKMKPYQRLTRTLEKSSSLPRINTNKLS